MRSSRRTSFWGENGSQSNSIHCLQILAGFEADGAAGGDIDAGAGAGVAAYAGFARFHGKNAEAAQLDAFAAAQRTLHGVEDGIDGCLGLVARQTGALHDTLDEILFDQAQTPFGVEGRGNDRVYPRW